jgi:hypothetical protein
MNRFTLGIELKNSAFESDWTVEVARILEEVVKRLKEKDIPRYLYDINGNSVGEIRVD